MSEGQDEIPYALTSVPSPPVLQGQSEFIKLLSLFISFCSSDDIFFSTAASSQEKTKGFTIQEQSPSLSCGWK